MKKLKLKLSMSLFLLGVINANATKHIIVAADFIFTPASVNVTVGDTIVWNFDTQSMMYHTTTAIAATIPATATPWDYTLDVTTPTFEYKVTVAGTYIYACQPHAGLGMTGTIIAKAATNVGIDEVNSSNKISVYPNPFTTSAVINLSAVAYSDHLSVSIYDILGNEVRKAAVVSAEQFTINRDELLSGIYFYQLNDAEKVIASGRLMVE